MSGSRLTFDLGVLDEGSQALKAHGGDVDSYRSELLGHIDRAIANFDGGVGTDEVTAVRAKVNELVEAHITDLREHGKNLDTISGDTQASMQQVSRGLSPH